MRPGVLKNRTVDLPVLTERLCLRAYRDDDLEDDPNQARNTS